MVCFTDDIALIAEYEKDQEESLNNMNDPLQETDMKMQFSGKWNMKTGKMKKKDNEMHSQILHEDQHATFDLTE